MIGISRRSAFQAAARVLGILVPTLLTVPRVAFARGSGLKFEIYKDGKGEFRWQLKAANGRQIASSGEGYKSKADCRNGIDLIKRGAATASVWELP